MNVDQEKARACLSWLINTYMPTHAPWPSRLSERALRALRLADDLIRLAEDTTMDAAEYEKHCHEPSGVFVAEDKLVDPYYI